MDVCIAHSPAQESTLPHFGAETFCSGKGEEPQLRMTPLNNGALPQHAGFWSHSKQGGTVEKRTKALDRDLQGRKRFLLPILHRKTRALNNPPPKPC